MSKNFELLQQADNEQDLFQTPGNPLSVADTADHKPKPAQGKEFHKRVLKSSSLPMRLPALIEEKANYWRKEIQRRKAYRQTDQDAITREEEVKLVQRVFSIGGKIERQVVLFSGIDEEAGCASICLRASEILAARAEGPVCVVDAALRSPSLNQYFGVANNIKGLAEAVFESGPVQDFAQQLPGRNLWVMPSGPVSSQLNTLLFSDRLHSRMTELRTVFKHVVIHSLPFNLDPITIPLSHLTDGVVLVLEANSTRRERARRVKKNLEAASVPVLGVVLNNRTFPIPEALYSRL
jgi:Mrp family chromosome partitioning ATPase